jgi:hypothetical protein
LLEDNATMRLTAMLFAAALGFAAQPISVEAAPAMPFPAGNGSSGPIIEVAVNCGPHAHYIRGHRIKGGQYVKGRCVRDRRHK